MGLIYFAILSSVRLLDYTRTFTCLGAAFQMGGYYCPITYLSQAYIITLIKLTWGPPKFSRCKTPLNVPRRGRCPRILRLGYSLDVTCVLHTAIHGIRSTHVGLRLIFQGLTHST